MDVIAGPFFNLLYRAINFYMWIVVISVVMSWLVQFNVINTSNRFVYLAVDFLYRITEPILGRIRRFMPELGGIDLSPVVLIFGLMFVQELVVNVARSV